MRKSSWKAAAAIIWICLLTGCSSEEDEGQYVQPEGLEPLRFTLIAPEEPDEVPAEAEIPPEETDSPMPEAEATGAEEESVMTVRRAAEVYNHPSGEGSEIGTVRRGERISAIGPADGGNWYIIEYNGRVAYIEADVIGAQETVPVSTPEVPRESTAAQPSPSPSPSGTPEAVVSQGQTSTPTPGRPAQEPSATASPTPGLPTSEPTAQPSASPEQPTAEPTVPPSASPERPTQEPEQPSTPTPEQPTQSPTSTPDLSVSGNDFAAAH